MNKDFSQTPPPPMIEIGHYRIVKKLGQGGMSIVYEGFDERLKRPVALKVLHPFLAEQKEYRVRFFREAQAVARLAHPNIAAIYDVSSSDEGQEHLYIAGELINGQTLKEYVKNVPLVKIPELSMKIIWELTLALEHAHQKKIIHRDIKPENIMVGDDGQIKLMDFGIATLGHEESFTQSGMLLGSLAYMAPEVIEGGKATIASDIFSLSTVFYWLLTGELPFRGDSPHALLKAIVEGQAKKVQTLSRYITDDIALVVEQGLHKAQSHRFESAGKMGAGIEKALSNMGIAINNKVMREALENRGALIEDFSALVHEQISVRIEYLKNNNMDAQAYALSARLTPDVVSTKCSTSTSKRLYGAVLAAVICCCGVLFFITKSPVEAIENRHDAVDLAKEHLGINKAPAILESFQEIFIDDHAVPVKKEKIDREQPSDNNLPREKAHNLQEIKMIIWPFANVFLDKKLMGKNQKSLIINVEKGHHKLLFTHPYAATIERELVVNDIDEPIELTISMVKSKPALLVIKANIEADVVVDGHFRGTTAESVVKPIVIFMPDKTHAIKKMLLVSKEGYAPHILKIELIAGQMKELEVTLSKGKANTGLVYE